MATTFVVAVTGCGGGGSSSGGGGGAQFAGTYQGTYQMTMTGGGRSTSGSGPIVIVIQPDNKVIRDPGSDNSLGILTGNSFSINNRGSSLNRPGVSCSGTFSLNGTVQGTQITGTLSSTNLRCNGMPLTITGSCNLQKVPTAARAALLDGGGNFKEFLQNAVR